MDAQNLHGPTEFACMHGICMDAQNLHGRTTEFAWWCGGASWWRVCYQQGVRHLVLLDKFRIQNTYWTACLNKKKSKQRKKTNLLIFVSDARRNYVHLSHLFWSYDNTEWGVGKCVHIAEGGFFLSFFTTKLSPLVSEYLSLTNILLSSQVQWLIMLNGYTQNPIKGGECFPMGRILTKLKLKAFYLPGKILPNCSKLFVWHYEYRNFDFYVWIWDSIYVYWYTNQS